MTVFPASVVDIFKGRSLAGERLLLRLTFWLLFFLILNYFAGRFYLVISPDIYPGLHLVLECASIVVAVMVSVVSWYEYKHRHELRMLLFSMTFALVALVDFAHSLSYLGMPSFITANSINKASTFWIIARLLQGAGLLAAIYVGYNKTVKINRPGLLMFVLVLLCLVMIAAVALYLPHLPPMYDEALGSQTILKICLEYLVMLMLGLSAGRLMLKKEAGRQDYYLCMGLLLGILSSLAFTFYSHAYDTYNLLGHIYKVLSFVFIFKALTDTAVGRLYQTNMELESRKEMLVETNQRLQEANLQLQEADKMKNEFLANTNHELRTPLSAIVAFTELLGDPRTGELNDVQKDYLNEINDSSEELLNRINGFLDLSKIAAGKATLYKEEFDINGLIRDVVRQVRPLYDSKGIFLSAGSGKVAVRLLLFADRDKVGQVLKNLLSNALKFTATGGSVNITARLVDEGRAVEVSVADTGIGIDPRDQEQIFQPFHQVDGTISRGFAGTGIGLALSKKLVELHGGDLTVSSKRNQGSVFSFTLPVQGDSQGS